MTEQPSGATDYPATQDDDQKPDVAAALTQAIPFNNHVGLHIDTARDGDATGELAVRPDLHNHIGTLHAAAQYALIEALSAATASVLLADIARFTPLVEAIEVRYLKLLRGTPTAGPQ